VVWKSVSPRPLATHLRTAYLYDICRPQDIPVVYSSSKAPLALSDAHKPTAYPSASPYLPYPLSPCPQPTFPLTALRSPVLIQAQRLKPSCSPSRIRSRGAGAFANVRRCPLDRAMLSGGYSTRARGACRVGERRHMRARRSRAPLDSDPCHQRRAHLRS
jgi:hypothetical protein